MASLGVVCIILLTMSAQFKYIYGPVHSWRMGMSLGIDPISTDEKKCNFDCIYCQLGRTSPVKSERKIFVATDDLMNEIKQVPVAEIDYFTFSGRGEPTLAVNIGEMIQQIRAIRKDKIAVITNSTLLYREDVQKDILGVDFVLAKLDVPNVSALKVVNNPADDIDFKRIVDGICDFRAKFKGKLAIQTMWVEGNKHLAKDVAKIVERIKPDEVQINTPLRPCDSLPLDLLELDDIKKSFSGVPVLMVYESVQQEYQPMDEEGTKKRHGQYKKV